MMTKKKILVVDDVEINRRFAENFLTEQRYSITAAEDFTQAISYLGVTDAQEPYAANHLEKSDFFALLTDLNFPLGENFTCHRGGSEVAPLGLTLALYGARLKIPYIAVLTDNNHHQDPLSSSLDVLYDEERPALDWGRGRQVFHINDSVFGIFDNRDFERLTSPFGNGKNWPAALEYLIQEGSR